MITTQSTSTKARRRVPAFSGCDDYAAAVTKVENEKALEFDAPPEQVRTRGLNMRERSSFVQVHLQTNLQYYLYPPIDTIDMQEFEELITWRLKGANVDLFVLL